MSRKQNTEYAGNTEASQYHRILGQSIYAADLDMIEYKYYNGKIKPIAVIDWKYPGETIGTKYSAIQLQIVVADALNIPFFICITYLDNSYSTKMYYVIPINDNAKSYFEKCELKKTGEWMSLYRFSRFRHALRGITWNPDEEIIGANLSLVGMPPGTKLRDLPKDKTIYPLPQLEI